MRAEAFELIERDARICGVRVAMPDGAMDLYADLVVGADGRTSTIRDLARLPVMEIGAPIDALWIRLPRHPDDDRMAALGNIRNGRVFVMLDRGEYWQCAYVISKGGLPRAAATRTRCVSRVDCRRRPVSRGSRIGDHVMERREAVDGPNRSAAAVASAGLVVHRRRGACDVADRRRRHQPRPFRTPWPRRTCSTRRCNAASRRLRSYRPYSGGENSQPGSHSGCR
jgi:2-polyprenyl-6-methoxyphenol hydroxylase-like FAD-dependent oxidoreductase